MVNSKPKKPRQKASKRITIFVGNGFHLFGKTLHAFHNQAVGNDPIE
jgi:hypothetical protein